MEFHLDRQFAELQIDVVWGEQGDDIATDYVGLDPISTPLNCLMLAGTFKLRTQEARAIETDVDNSFTNNDNHSPGSVAGAVK
ncbi:uncharacterized protein LW94_3707 [Fusarium fujikuroi]|nr:uncharacterized protein LW94_3707 [Fusarium fujikuroi]SCO35161.1 uncharacterized protein FFMR_03780 [Fusarium fujikuroi]